MTVWEVIKKLMEYDNNLQVVVQSMNDEMLLEPVSDISVTNDEFVWIK